VARVAGGSVEEVSEEVILVGALPVLADARDVEELRDFCSFCSALLKKEKKN
jgi:hypothetical protein